MTVPAGPAKRARFLGTGSGLPDRVVTNEELSAQLDTTDDWITARTGIKQRRIAAEGQLTSDLATEAARNALDAAGLTAADVDLIVLATATPDETFPSTATRVQAKLGARGPALDVAAVCTGFVYAMVVAEAMMRAGQGTTALLIGAETFSRILDWEDRTTAVLFGDGAGAVVMRLEDAADPAQGLLAADLDADGGLHDLLYVDGGPSSTGTVGHLRMQGREVFKHAVTNMCTAMLATLEKAGVSADAVDWFVPHQANKRIIDATAKKMGIAPERVVMTVDRHANTSAASVPLALDVAVRDGRIQPGDLVLFEAMGGGLTWGAALVRW